MLQTATATTPIEWRDGFGFSQWTGRVQFLEQENVRKVCSITHSGHELERLSRCPCQSAHWVSLRSASLRRVQSYLMVLPVLLPAEKMIALNDPRRLAVLLSLQPRY